MLGLFSYPIYCVLVHSVCIRKKRSLHVVVMEQSCGLLRCGGGHILVMEIVVMEKRFALLQGWAAVLGSGSSSYGRPQSSSGGWLRTNRSLGRPYEGSIPPRPEDALGPKNQLSLCNTLEKRLA